MPEPATHPVETPPPATPPPAAPAPAPDPWQATILADIGKVLNNGKLEDKIPAAPEHYKSAEQTFVTMGDVAKANAEKKAAAEKPPEETPPAKKEGEAPPVPDPAAGDKPPEKKEEPPKVPAPAAPAKKKVEVERAKPIEEIVEAAVNKLVKPAAPPPAPAAMPAKKADAPDPDAAYIEGLSEIQREEIDLARYAAKAMPDKYANMAQRTVDYIKKVDAFIDKKREADPEWDHDADETFAQFIEENRPTYAAGDEGKLKTQRIVDATEERLDAKYKPRIEDAERRARAQELKPELEAASKSYREQVVQNMVADEKDPFNGVVSKIKEKGDEGWTEAKTENALATNIVRTYADRAVELGTEYLGLVSGVNSNAAFDAHLPPNHAANKAALRQSQLFQFIDSQEQIFLTQGGNDRVVQGKMFTTRAQWQKMTPEQQEKHWVLGHQDVLDMLAVAAKEQAHNAYSAEVQRRKDEGYEPVAKQAAPKKEEPAPAKAKTTESPKATSQPGPGAGTTPPPPPPQRLMTDEELKRLWSQGPASMVA